MSRDKAIKHIGLFGGSFDPVHRGHLLAAESVQRQLSLDEIVFLPAAQSPFKSRPQTSVDDRREMLAIAIEGNPYFKLDQRELLRSGPSYTIDTLRELVAEQPQSQFYLMMGMDAWAEFESWRDWREILTLCHLIVMTRPDYEAASMPLEWQQRQLVSVREIRQLRAGKLLFVKVPSSTAASRNIRKLTQKREPVGDVLPAKVRAYIEAQGLYR